MAIIEVIKYEGANDVLVWKHPKEDYNTDAQLIVHESQEAIVINSGHLSEPYTAGRYTLETENIPGVRGLVGLVTGGVSPNHYEVYFINKAYSMDVYWGSNSPWIIQDPSIQVPISMQVRGQFAVKAADSKKLILKLVGTTTSFTQKSLKEYFRGILLRDVKSYISSYISQEQLLFAQISENLKSISEGVEPQLASTFDKYGLCIEDFAIESIDIVKDEAYRRIREAMTNRGANTMEGLTQKEKLGIDVLKTQAGNPGMGNFAGPLAGMGMGMGMAHSMAAVSRDLSKSVMGPVMGEKGEGYRQEPRDPYSVGTVQKKDEKEINTSIVCVNCGKEIPAESRFCSYCGKAVIEKEEEMICTNCGQKVPSGSRFCNQCGEKLEDSNE